MDSDDIKRDFVQYMEAKHTGLRFPKNYFGCMMAVFIEPEPITQDRIEELTNYSKTTISQILKIIQLNFTLKRIKKPGIRKAYYTIDIPVREFMITFLKMILDSYKDRIDFILPLIEEIRPHIQKHPRFDNFMRFLEQYYEFSTLYINLLSDTTDEFSNLIKTGQVNASELFSLNMLSSQENLQHIQRLLNPSELSSSFPDLRFKDERLSEIYTRLKNNFYQQFRDNLTLAGSQTAIARAIIGTELLLEQRPMTQEEIEIATNFQRSTISDTLKLLLQMKMIQLIKKPGDRKKYYIGIQSWDRRIITRFKLSQNDAIAVQQKLSSFIEQIDPNNSSADSNSLVIFLQHIHHSYVQFEQYFKLLEVKYLNIRLKEYLVEN